MSLRLASFVVAPVVLVAGILVLQDVERVPDATAATWGVSAPLAPAGEMMAPESTETLPPGHPPIGTATSPHGSVPSASDEAPAIASKMPAT
jgi:hypothetical protein